MRVARLECPHVLSLRVPHMSGRRLWLFRLWGEPLARGWAGKMQDANLQQLNPALAVSGGPGNGGESVIWLHRGLIALHLSNLISCRHLPAPELLFCILNPSDLKWRTQFYFARLLHHLNWSLKYLKHFCTNFLCLKLIWTPGGVNFSWLSAGDLLKSCQKSLLPQGWGLSSCMPRPKWPLCVTKKLGT